MRGFPIMTDFIELEALPRLLTLSEVAEKLAVSRATVWRLIKKGALPGVNIGHSLRVRVADLAEFMQKGGGR